MTEDPCQKLDEELRMARDEMIAARQDYNSCASLSPLDPRTDREALPHNIMALGQRLREAEEKHAALERAYLECRQQHNRKPKWGGADLLVTGVLHHVIIVP